MYSIVLLAAMSTSADLPAFGHHRCHGCYGCYSCGCYSYGCYGGCYGGCGCYGGYSGCCGCYGGYSGCYGCYGGYSGCCGGYSGCWGGCYGCCGTVVVTPQGGQGGGQGGGQKGGAALTADEQRMLDELKKDPEIKDDPEKVKQLEDFWKGATPAERKKTYDEQMKKRKGGDKDGDKEAKVPSNRALILVSLPAEAKLTIDDHPTVSTTANRRFITPALKDGRTYSYTFKAEIVRDGQKVVTSKKVAIRAGAETRVRFEFPAANVVRK